MGSTTSADRNWTAAEWATFYVVELGWPVFPLRPRSKAPLSDAALGLLHGKNDATKDRARVREIWQRYCDAGVGVVSGAESGVVFVDVDPRNDGDNGLKDLESEYGRLPIGPVSLTGGGGTHAAFAHPGHPLRSRNNLGGYRGVDLKADGGYVVAPPSVHPNGVRYAWNPQLHPIATAIPPCPVFVVDLASRGKTLAARGYAQRSWDGALPLEAVRLIARSAKIHARFHRRTDGLTDQTPSGVDFSLACQLARAGLDPSHIEAALMESRARAGLPLGRDSYYRATVGKALTLRDRAEGRAA